MERSCGSNEGGMNMNTNKYNGKSLSDYILELEKQYVEAINNSDYYSAKNIRKNIDALKAYYYGV